MATTKVGRFVTPAAQRAYDTIYDEAVKSFPAPVQTHDVETGFGPVRVYGFGQDTRPPIVLLHGRGASSVMWLPNLAALAERRRVYALDLLGEGGRSVQTHPIRDAADQAAWLEETLEELGVDAAHLVGHSIGGWLACNHAVRAPARLVSLTLIDPALTLAYMPLSLLLRVIPTTIPITATRAVPAFMRWSSRGEPYDENDPEVQLITSNLLHYRFALPAPTRFTDDQLRAVSIPTLVLIAGRSIVHDPRKAYERARALIPDVQAELWPQATHGITGQCADEVNARLLRFVEEH
ncbi:alpha/beta fold hydrolase [Nonomuraea sp. NPDC050540]|uniref:alpha/beta fold hydrolase n=1 Tax=Nonomuraea sp. NPDC050540 TaxID=3364367 RepID=UPI00379F3DB2